MQVYRPYSIQHLLKGFNGNRVILTDRNDLFRIRHDHSLTIALAEIAVDLFGVENGLKPIVEYHIEGGSFASILCLDLHYKIAIRLKKLTYLHVHNSHPCSLVYAQGAVHRPCLSFYRSQGPKCKANTAYSYDDQNQTEKPTCLAYPVFRYGHGGKFADSYGLFGTCGCWIGGGCLLALGLFRDGRRPRRGSNWFHMLCSGLLALNGRANGAIGCLPGD
jgi:hypothetical protein